MKKLNPKILLDEIFTFGFASGWDVDDRGGEIVAIGHACNVFKNNKNKFPIQCTRRFDTITGGELVLEFRFKIRDAKDGFWYGLSKGKEPVFRLETKGNRLCALNSGGYSDVLEYEEKVVYAIRAKINLDVGVSEISVNGKSYGEFPLASGCKEADRVIITSPTSEENEVSIYYLKMYSDYTVYEKFNNCMPGRLPYDWKVEGAYESDAFVEYLKGYDSAESHVLLIADGRRAPKPTVVTKSFEPIGGRVRFSFGFLLAKAEAKENGISFALMSKGKEAVMITAKKCGIYNGDSLLKKYNQNVWQRVNIDADFDRHEAEITVNNTQIGTVIIPEDIQKTDQIRFKTYQFERTSCEIENVMLYRLNDSIDDYPTPPQKPATKYNIGMQTCFLWSEGHGPGWDKIECHPERKPYLGYYEETLPEKMDWEIKWMAEHGISYMLPCWYPADDYRGGPVRCATLYEYYFGAKYKEHLGIALQPCDIGAISEKDFMEYMLPYWIENFFSYPGYVKIDNKPLIAFLSAGMIAEVFGGGENINRGLEAIRQACRDAGFDGAYLILNEQHRTPAQVRISSKQGFDAIYSYGWGRVCHHENAQINILDAQRKMELIDVIPTVVQGYNDVAWNGVTDGGYVSLEEFKKTLEWVRDDFLPGINKENPTSNMVLLGNWNELGEGHFFTPTELCGFGYLDILRETFCEYAPHTDVRPTEAQLERLQTRYPKTRKALKKVKPYPSSDGAVIKGWYFNKKEDAEKWSCGGGIENLRLENGCLVGDTEGAKGYIYLNEEVSINCRNSTFIRLSIKVEEAEDMLFTFCYTTSDDSEWNDEKRLRMYVTENYIEECNLPVYNNKRWQKTVTGLKLYPISTPGRFTIRAIEILEFKEEPVRAEKDGEERYLFQEPIMENGIILAPVEGIRDYVGVMTIWNSEDNTLLAADDKTEIIFTFGKDVATVNGKEEKIGTSPVLKDRVAYLPIEFICQKVGTKVTFDEDAKVLRFE